MNAENMIVNLVIKLKLWKRKNFFLKAKQNFIIKEVFYDFEIKLKNF